MEKDFLTKELVGKTTPKKKSYGEYLGTSSPWKERTGAEELQRSGLVPPVSSFSLFLCHTCVLTLPPPTPIYDDRKPLIKQ